MARPSFAVPPSSTSRPSSRLESGDRERQLALRSLGARLVGDGRIAVATDLSVLVLRWAEERILNLGRIRHLGDWRGKAASKSQSILQTIVGGVKVRWRVTLPPCGRPAPSFRRRNSREARSCRIVPRSPGQRGKAPPYLHLDTRARGENSDASGCLPHRPST